MKSLLNLNFVLWSRIMKQCTCRVLREKEQSFTQSTINKDALEEEKKQVAVMQNEILEERRKLQEEVKLSAYGASKYIHFLLTFGDCEGFISISCKYS